MSPRRKPALSNPRKLLILGVIMFGFITWAVWYKYKGLQSIQWDYSKAAGIRIPTEFEVHGIDVSKHQGPIEWASIETFQLPASSRLSFVFIKATEGISIQDKRFKLNYAAARKTRLRVGAYHFFIPWRDPVPQADNFVRTVQLQSGDLPPVLDIESSHPLKSDNQTIRDIDTWLRLVEKQYKVRPIIYTNRRFYQRYIREHFNDYPLWLADYSSDQIAGDISGKLWFWQYSELGRIPGIRGKVDFNTFLGDLEDLEQICLP
ncbi:MAG: GH25 family lysozyme [Siphonobacter sp.]